MYSKKIFSPKVILLIIIFFGSILRFYNLMWGDGHFFNPDERNLAISVSQLKWPDFHPHFFAYGQFSIYLAYFSGFFARAILAMLQRLPLETTLPFSTAVFWLRFWSALTGILTIPLVYLLTKEMLTPNLSLKLYALLAPLLVAFTPGLIQSAHFGTTESLLTFFFMLILYLTIRFLKTAQIKYLFWAGLFSGLALGTKLSASFFLLAPTLAIIFVSKRKVTTINKGLMRFLSLFFIFYFLFFILFVLSSPYNLLSFQDFLGTSRYETSVATGEVKTFYTRQFEKTTPIIFQLKQIFPYALGWPLFIFGSIGIIFVVFYILKNFASMIFLNLQKLKIPPEARFANGGKDQSGALKSNTSFALFLSTTSDDGRMDSPEVKIAEISPPSEEWSKPQPHLGGVSLPSAKLVSKKDYFNLFAPTTLFQANFFILLFAFLFYFVPTAYLFAKWTRFVTPIMPFFAIFASYFLSKFQITSTKSQTISKLQAQNSKQKILNLKIGNWNLFGICNLIIGISVLLCIIPGLSFFSIYTRPDVRLQASHWIYQNIPSDSYILSETANVVDIPLGSPPEKTDRVQPLTGLNLKVISFDFYHLDQEPDLLDELIDHLEKADYIFIPSRRIFVNHLRLPDQYPLVNNYYQAFFDGRLGFELVHLQTFRGDETLSKQPYLIDDEAAEETFTVFDHPVIRIYQKKNFLTKEAYQELLTKDLGIKKD